MEVIDTPVDVSHKAVLLKAQGVKAIIRYISPINLAGSKTIKKAEADAILAAGLQIGFVCEGWGGSDNFSHHDITATTGTRDGAACGEWMRRLGAPRGTAVYAAIDNDASAAQITSLCLPYFKSFRAALDPDYDLGAYGCGALLAVLKQRQMVNYLWLSNAMGWNESRAMRDAKGYDILQHLETRLLGIDVDPDELNPASSEVGFWKPAVAA